MRRSSHLLICLATGLLLCPRGPATAGGLWIHEFGAPAQGRVNAGAYAGVDDASTTLFNAASMSRLNSTQLMVTSGLVVTTVEFDVDRASILNRDGDGGDAGGLAPGLLAD